MSYPKHNYALYWPSPGSEYKAPRRLEMLQGVLTSPWSTSKQSRYSVYRTYRTRKSYMSFMIFEKISGAKCLQFRSFRRLQGEDKQFDLPLVCFLLGSEVLLSKDPNLFPFFPSDAHKCVHHFGIEMSSRTSHDFLASDLVGLGSAIWAVAQNRIERIGHRENPSMYVNVVALEFVRIAAPVVLLVMLSYDKSGTGQ